MKHYIPEYPEYKNNQAHVIIHCESGRRTKGMFYWNGTKPTFASFGIDITDSVIAWEYDYNSASNIIGKTLKSKINGNLFFVNEIKIEGKRAYYIVSDIGTGKLVPVDKKVFEQMIMKNLEFVEDEGGSAAQKRGIE